MKTKIAIISGLLMAFIAISNKSFSQCETALPNDLQSCINSKSLPITVTVISGTAFLSGNLNSMSEADALYSCMVDYNNAASSCPGAPVLNTSNVNLYLTSTQTCGAVLYNATPNVRLNVPQKSTIKNRQQK